MLSAKDLIKITPDTDYSKEKNKIVSIHCTKTSESPVIIETISGSSVEFPEGSFIRGAVYHISIKKIYFNPVNTGFIGYRQV